MIVLVHDDAAMLVDVGLGMLKLWSILVGWLVVIELSYPRLNMVNNS